MAADTARDRWSAGCSSFLRHLPHRDGLSGAGNAVTARALARADALGHRSASCSCSGRGRISATRRGCAGWAAEAARLWNSLEHGRSGQRRAFCWGCTRFGPGAGRADATFAGPVGQGASWALLSYLMASAAELKGERGDQEGARELLADAADLGS